MARAAVLVFVPLFLGRFNAVVVTVVVHRIVAALTALLVDPGPALAEHPEIVVRELKIIFTLNAVSGELRIASHVLVFLEQLGGIAALPIILAIAGLAPDVLAPLAAAAPAATLSIIDQNLLPQSSRRLSPLPSGNQTAPSAAPSFRSDLATCAKRTADCIGGRDGLLGLLFKAAPLLTTGCNDDHGKFQALL
jgi:hypothetical protein